MTPGLAVVVFMQPGGEAAESHKRVLFVSLKLIHCHSTPPHPLHQPKKTHFSFAIQSRSGVGLSF